MRRELEVVLDLARVSEPAELPELIGELAYITATAQARLMSPLAQPPADSLLESARSRGPAWRLTRLSLPPLQKISIYPARRPQTFVFKRGPKPLHLKQAAGMIWRWLFTPRSLARLIFGMWH
jgi:hypothetical protein